MNPYLSFGSENVRETEGKLDYKIDCFNKNCSYSLDSMKSDYMQLESNPMTRSILTKYLRCVLMYLTILALLKQIFLSTVALKAFILTKH